MSDGVPIFEIYALSRPVTIKNNGWPEYGRRDSMGFFYELETAIQAVKENWTDINEKGTYDAAIIVQKKPGLYPIALKKGYFIFNHQTEKYDEATLPKEMESFNLA